ncbi:hypothetical protein [Pseudomonas sp. L13]|uniref:hypothetical protein n=1 Tax=Pseudomonas sp. L13 TaxID=343985 RepID=UPI002113B66A|nr:hypothetical protein [Pseudomonas sp. L13]
MMIQATETAGGQSQRFRDALKFADLPADDIDLPGRTFFEFTLDSKTVAWGGFETHGTDGLLRSLVVVSTFRSKGSVWRCFGSLKRKPPSRESLDFIC